MAIFTPRGLKIRLPIDYSFALISRLYPKIDAFKILKTTEGLESLSAAITFITAIVCFYLKLSFFEIGLYVFLASMISFLITTFGLYIIPGLNAVGTAYSYLSSYGILLIILAGFGFYFAGWQGVAAFFIAKFLAGIIKMAIEYILLKHLHKKTGLTFTSSEKNFLNAYRIHASRLGITTNIIVSDEELKKDNWALTYNDLAFKWPKVTDRFTTD